MSLLGTLIREEIRFLTFRAPGPAFRENPGAFLAFGLLFTWLSGMGRYWDNPRAEPWQLLGLGSVAYVYILALILWLAVLPLRPQSWSYRNVLLLVCLTSPPALLYAVPVERFLTADLARATNAWFLGIVAMWRVGLWFNFVLRGARLRFLIALIATLLPIAALVFVLAALNLEHVVFNLMSGIPEDQTGPHDKAYLVVVTLAMTSFVAAPVLALAYLGAIFWSRWPRAKAAPDPGL